MGTLAPKDRVSRGLADAIVSSIRERLEQHPHFRGRASLLTIESIDGSIVVSGRLPSYYLKQLLQEAIKEIPGVEKIDNHVDVVWPTS
jgi:osmotically-inducible protein OsmY